MITDGVREGWAASAEVDRPNYRRGRIASPSERLNYFSVTAVYMNSIEPYRGEYHQHPYGELNVVVPLDPLIALFYLPAGRISYDITPPAE